MHASRQTTKAPPQATQASAMEELQKEVVEAPLLPLEIASSGTRADMQKRARFLNRAPAHKQAAHQPLLLQWQQQRGNGFVSEVIHQARHGRASSAPIQAKLTLGPVDDPYEQEADRIARDVVQRLHAPPTPPDDAPEEQPTASGSVGTPRPGVMRAVTGPASAPTGDTVSRELEASIYSARGRGHILPEHTRQPMEQAFGADFGNVRIHTDSRSDQLNRAIEARAFTTGQDIFFRQGEYNPTSRDGKELLAHELTHVVQQAGGTVQRAPETNAALVQHSPPQQIQRAPGPTADTPHHFYERLRQYNEEAWELYKVEVAGEIPYHLAAEKYEALANKMLGMVPIDGYPYLDNLAELHAARMLDRAIEAMESGQQHDDIDLYRRQRIRMTRNAARLKHLKAEEKTQGSLYAEQKEEQAALEAEQKHLGAERSATVIHLYDAWKQKKGFEGVPEQDIIRRYGFNWFRLKEDLAYQKEAESDLDYEMKLAAMEQMLAYRVRIVGQSGENPDGLLGETVAYINNKYRSLTPKLQVKASAFGSVSPTSDYDVTFEIPNYPEKEYEAVDYFNTLFWERYGVSSGVMFDTNVYTSGFLPVAHGEALLQKDAFTEMGEEDKQFVQDAKTGKKHIQMALAFVAIRQYFDASPQAGARWAQFKENTEAELSAYLSQASQGLAPGAKQPRVTGMHPFLVHELIIQPALDDLHTIFTYTEEIYQDTQETIAAARDHQQADPRVREAMQQQGLNPDAEALHIETLAKNQRYIDTLKKVSLILDDLKENERKLKSQPATQDTLAGPGERATPRRSSSQLLSLPPIPLEPEEETTLPPTRKDLLADRAKLIIDFEIEQGKALIYANEAYFDSGSAAHVVLKMQAGANVKIGRKKRMQSLLMNAGYKLQHFKHAQAHHGLGRALVGTAKYGERIGDLALAEHPSSTAADRSLSKDLSEATRDLLRYETSLIRHYKKDDQRFPTPSEKETAAASAFRNVTPENVESAFLEIAQKALGPYYWDKHASSRESTPSSSRRESGASLSSITPRSMLYPGQARSRSNSFSIHGLPPAVRPRTRRNSPALQSHLSLPTGAPGDQSNRTPSPVPAPEALILGRLRSHRHSLTPLSSDIQSLASFSRRWGSRPDLTSPSSENEDLSWPASQWPSQNVSTASSMQDIHEESTAPPYMRVPSITVNEEEKPASP